MPTGSGLCSCSPCFEAPSRLSCYSQEGGGNHCASCWASSRRGVTACPRTQLAASGPGPGWRPPARVFSCSSQQLGSGGVPGPEGWGGGGRCPRVRCGPGHPPVVASPGDGSILVAALLLLVLDSTATGLGQQPQLGFCQHIWGWDRWAGSWVQGPGSFLTGAVPYLASLDPLPSQQPRLSALPSQVRAGPGARGGAQYQ